jgi:hypothetical protein
MAVAGGTLAERRGKPPENKAVMRGIYDLSKPRKCPAVTARLIFGSALHQVEQDSSENRSLGIGVAGASRMVPPSDIPAPLGLNCKDLLFMISP